MSDKAKKILINCFMALLTIVGLALIFNEQIKSFIVDHMQENALEQPIKKHPKKGQFDAGKVGEVTPEDVARAAMKEPSDAIGKISIPAVGLRLPIFYGMATNNMMRGACTMRPNEQMGMQGNYTLAGHHMMDNQILFGPLQNVRDGNLIYLTDGKKVYTYKTVITDVVSEYQTVWLNNVPNAKVITLITCASGHTGETRRIVIRGQLQKVQKANAKNLKLFAAYH